MLKKKNRRAEIKEDYETQIEIYVDYIPNRNKINSNPNQKIGCDVCGKILRRGYMKKKHRMPLNCKALVNVKLYFEYNRFELSCDNIYKVRHTMMYGDFENCLCKSIDEDRK